MKWVRWPASRSSGTWSTSRSITTISWTSSAKRRSSTGTPLLTPPTRMPCWPSTIGAYSRITAMIRSAWTLKPNAQVWIDTTQQLWHTDAAGTSWQGGQFVVRGYDGTYSVTVTYNGQTVTVPVTLAAGGSSVVVTLPI